MKLLLTDWKHQAGLGVGMMAISAALFLLVGVNPLLARAKDGEALRRELHDHEQLQSELMQSRRSIVKELSKLENSFRASFELRPVQAENQQLGKITEIATRFGVEVSSLKPSSPIRGTQYSWMPIRVSAIGGTQEVASMLRAMHNELPTTIVRQFQTSTIEPAAQSGQPIGPPDCRLELELVWFVRAESVDS